MKVWSLCFSLLVPLGSMPPDLAIIPWADQPLAGLYRLIAAAIFSKRKYAETISFTPFYRGTRHNNSRISPADPPAHGASGTFPSCGHSTGRTISPMRLCLDGLSQLARPTVSSRVRFSGSRGRRLPKLQRTPRRRCRPHRRHYLHQRWGWRRRI